MYTYAMDFQPYIPGLSPAEPGPLARFTPPLEEGVISAWLPLHAPPSPALAPGASVDAAQGKAGSWVLDPFGVASRLVLEAARAGYRVLVTVNNPITRFLLEMSANPPSETDFKAAFAASTCTCARCKSRCGSGQGRELDIGSIRILFTPGAGGSTRRLSRAASSTR